MIALSRVVRQSISQSEVVERRAKGEGEHKRAGTCTPTHPGPARETLRSWTKRIASRRRTRNDREADGWGWGAVD